jgi:hypothetical protein
MPARSYLAPADDTVRSDISETDQKLITFALEYKRRLTQQKWIFEREWYRNVLFYIGQQWITYEESFRRWRRRNMPVWVPLPVTNRLASTVNVIRSAVAQVHPAFEARPTMDNERSVLTANAADKYLEIIMQESGFRAARRRMASWLVLTGNAFLATEFDTSKETGTVFVPGEVCASCGFEMKPTEIPQNLTCPECGSTDLQDAPDLGVELPQGRIVTRAVSPFEVYVDNHIQELEDQPAILLVEVMNQEVVRRLYPKSGAEAKPDTDREIGRYYLDSLAYMTATGFGSGSPAQRSSESGESGGVTVYKLHVKTAEHYPDGIFIAWTGDGHVLEAIEPYPHRFLKTGKTFYPLVHLRYDDVPARFWAKTPVDDLIPKQRQRNEMESLFQTIIMRCANPIWLIPQGVQHTPISGDPAIQVRYSGAGGAKPERLQGLDAPASVPKFIEMIDQDFEEIANTFAVLKGKSPGSVRAASAIQMLIERGFGRYGSVFDNLEEGYEKWAVQALELWRQKAVFPRVQAVATVTGGWQFLEFLGSDLGEIDIRVEAGSTRPKSQAGRQMMLNQVMTWGLLNPNDPEQRIKIFEELGAESLLPGAEADIKVVAEENALFMQWAEQASQALKSVGDEVPPEQSMALLLKTFPLRGNPILDHHPTHMVHHRRLGLSDRFRALPPIIQNLFVQHMLQAHYLPMVQETMVGMGPLSLAVGMMQQQQGPQGPGQNRPQQPGGARQGKGPGGQQGPFGAETQQGTSNQGAG